MSNILDEMRQHHPGHPFKIRQCGKYSVRIYDYYYDIGIIDVGLYDDYNNECMYVITIVNLRYVHRYQCIGNFNNRHGLLIDEEKSGKRIYDDDKLIREMVI